VTETVQILISLLLLFLVFILTRYGVVLMMKRASRQIIADLEKQGATDPASAVDLPYAKSRMFRIGLRDYRPKTLQGMVQAGVVGTTSDGRYYLRSKDLIEGDLR
jgi:hypothetical protein